MASRFPIQRLTVISFSHRGCRTPSLGLPSFCCEAITMPFWFLER
jgi:hypothetical protein